MSMSDNKAQAGPSMEEILVSIRRILAEDEGIVPVIARSRVAADVLDLTEAIEEDGTIRHIPVSARASAPPLPDGRIEPGLPRHSETAAAPLVSAVASGAAAAAFSRLTSVPREPRRAADGSLEELVRDLLRPMLQEWLEENLPGLVERLVRAEIARVVGDTTPH
jgi:cell pole-organizing protein PopZ